MAPTPSPICLLGESDTFLSRLLARFCEAAGLSCLRAQVGEELLSLAEECHPDLIILDVELPGEQRGWQAVQALKALAGGQQSGAVVAPIISCSWLSRAEAAALAPDCAAYLQKPDLHYDDFVRAVGSALGDAGFEG